MVAASVNSGGRLDRLPISPFHYRVLGLVSAGMFLDAFEIYLAGGVLAALVKSGWSDLAHNGWFISTTFAGMMVGAWCAGIFGDRYGRRFSYQLNLLIFGIASLGGAAAPSIEWLIVARFFMGIGLGAEIVVGYVTLSEFVPPLQRGRWGSASPQTVPQLLARQSIGRCALRRGIGHDISPAIRPGAERAARLAESVRLYRSSPLAPARPRIPAPGGDQTSRASRAPSWNEVL